MLEPLVASYEDATERLFRPGVHANPAAVAEEIRRILALPAGTKPFRCVVDFTDSGAKDEVNVEAVNAVARRHQERFISRMGFGELLQLNGVPRPNAPTAIRAGR